MKIKQIFPVVALAILVFAGVASAAQQPTEPRTTAVPVQSGTVTENSPINIALAADYLNLSADGVGNPKTSIGLSWDGSPGRTYKVKWRKSSGGPWTENEVEENNPSVQVGSGYRWSYTVGNLSCNTKYDLEVKMKGRGWRNVSASTSGCGSVACPKGGWYDGANCKIGQAPAGTTAFIWGGNYYYTPKPSGTTCPYPGSTFDTANCFVQKIPSGVESFIYGNSWYYKAFP